MIHILGDSQKSKKYQSDLADALNKSVSVPSETKSVAEEPQHTSNNIYIPLPYRGNNKFESLGKDYGLIFSTYAGIYVCKGMFFDEDTVKIMHKPRGFGVVTYANDNLFYSRGRELYRWPNTKITQFNSEIDSLAISPGGKIFTSLKEGRIVDDENKLVQDVIEREEKENIFHLTFRGNDLMWEGYIPGRPVIRRLERGKGRIDYEGPNSIRGLTAIDPFIYFSEVNLGANPQKDFRYTLIRSGAGSFDEIYELNHKYGEITSMHVVNTNAGHMLYLGDKRGVELFSVQDRRMVGLVSRIKHPRAIVSAPISFIDKLIKEKQE